MADLGFSIDARPDTAAKRQLSQKDQARRKREQGQADREAKLAKLIFHDESLLDELEDDPAPRRKQRGRLPAQAEGGGGDDDEDDDEGKEGDEGDSEEEQEDKAPKAAWVDEDDATLRVDVMKQKRLRKLRKTKKEGVLQGADYEERLRAQWQSTQRNASWATAAEADAAAAALQGDAAGDKAAALLRSAAPLLASGAAARRGGPLAAGKLSIKRVTSAPSAPSAPSPTSAPAHPLLHRR